MRFFFTLLIILLWQGANAQLQRNYTIYNVDNGLAQNTVWDAIQDNKGFMWFGTADGINRFDGYKMHKYQRSETNKTTIGGTTSFSFFEDTKKQLWIAHDRGIDVYNRPFDNFIRINQGQNGAAIIGQSNDSIVWAILKMNYIHGYNINTFKLVYKIPVKFNWNNSHGSTLSSVKINNSFFIGDMQTTIIEFIPAKLKVKYHVITKEIGFHLHKLSDSTFCRFYKNSVSLVTVVNNKINVKSISYPHTNMYFFSGGTVYDNKLYATGSSGLFVFDKTTLSPIRREINFNATGNASFYYIQNARSDKNNNLYLCSNGGGLYVYSPFRNKFKHYTNNNSQKNLVKAVTKLPDGRILAGVYAEGLTIYNADGTFKIIKQNIPEDQVGTVNAFYPKTKTEQWLIYANKISTLNTNTHQIKSYPLANSAIGFAYPVFDSLFGRLVVNGSINTSSFIIDVYTKKILYSLDINNISCYKQLNDSVAIIGGIEGVFLFNKNTKITTKTPIKNFVKSILVYGNNQIYLATINGLFLVDNNCNIKQHYTVSNGLANEFIYGLLTDKHGNIWLSHNKGISELNPALNTFKHYGVKDGLQSSEFNTGAFYKDENELLYFGGVNGVNVIDPDNIVENTTAPNISINEVLLDDLPYKTDSNYNEIKQLKLNYLQNTLSFDFSALDFSQPENNTYKYTLEGFDANWIESGTKHFARYANLPAGNYVFKIIAANGDGYWSKKPKTVSIVIIPPFWQRSWFFILTILLAIGLLSTGVYFFNKRQKIKLIRELEVQHKLEKERMRISQDLHDNVGAQLSYLITNIEWMLNHPEQIDKAEESKRLLALTESGRNTILTLRQTIWAISQSSLNVDDFADRFKQFALKMMEFNKVVQLNFTEQFDTNNKLSPEVALNLFRICQEAFNNCFKHAKALNININFGSNKEILFWVEVADNGVGFNPSEHFNGHYGLENMKTRAGENGIELTIESKIGQGTTIRLEVKK